MYWLSYGGGVNSTALVVMLCNGEFPEYEPWRCVFADTGNEKDATYEYIANIFGPYLEQHGHHLETVRPKESVLERWERLSVTGSRLLRSCTAQAKIAPIQKHIDANGAGIQLIGIDAGEIGRARAREGVVYPLVDRWIAREGCVEIIKNAGLPVPVKSGCWHCPFMRVGEILELAIKYPCRFERIAALEKRASEVHGGSRYQWHERSCDYWRERAATPLLEALDDYAQSPPCGCYDG